jgi:RNA polymerase sigma-70 factor, ECF subfamily
MELAADITSDVFVKAILALPKYTYKGVPFSSWLFRIASNTLVDYFRSRESERVLNIETLYLSKMITDEMEENPEEENIQVLLDILPQLQPKDLVFIEMRFFEHRSFREIGEIMQLTETNAKIRTYRILNKLKQKMIKTLEYESKN